MSRAFIHEADGHLTVVFKPRISDIDFFNRSEILQTPRQRRSLDACQMSERYNHCEIQARGVETSGDLVVRRG